MLHKEQLQFWIDLNLPRSMATWLTQDYGVTAYSFAELGFENVSDVESRIRQSPKSFSGI